MIRSISRWPALVSAAVLCVLLATGCDGDDEADRSTAPDQTGSEEIVDGSGEDGSDDGEDDDPFTEECTLARQETKNLLDPPDDYLELRVTATPGEFDGSTCEWSSSSYAMELMVMVKSYDVYYHDESDGKPIPGLGDESWYSTKVDNLYWRRDGYAVSIHSGSATQFEQRQLIDLAHAIDADLPAE